MYWNFEKIIIKPGARRFDGHERPISVEIGFGNGEYLQYLAASRPDSLAIGIEVSQWCASKAARRVLANGLGNVKILCGDARYLLKFAFEPACISEIFMNFPCPWPKRRHTERRVARGDFADLLASRLAANGTFTLATDVDWYAEATEEIFAEHPAFETTPVKRNPERDYATKYERKWRGMGRDIFEFRARKREGCEPEDMEQDMETRAKEDDETQTDESEIYAQIEPTLTETEQGVAKRARNHHSNNPPKSTSIGNYKKATAVEALIGFWHLTGNLGKINTVVNMARTKEIKF